MVAGHFQKTLKGNDSRQTDERLKLVSDVVVGVRTIKCYGWENQYLKKLDKIRSAQSPNVFKMNFLATYGTSMF